MGWMGWGGEWRRGGEGRSQGVEVLEAFAEKVCQGASGGYGGTEGWGYLDGGLVGLGFEYYLSFLIVCFGFLEGGGGFQRGFFLEYLVTLASGFDEVHTLLSVPGPSKTSVRGWVRVNSDIHIQRRIYCI